MFILFFAEIINMKKDLLLTSLCSKIRKLFIINNSYKNTLKRVSYFIGIKLVKNYRYFSQDIFETHILLLLMKCLGQK